MAADIFLRLEGIEGESQDDKHRNEIEVLSWSWSVKNTGSFQLGTGAGRVKA